MGNRKFGRTSHGWLLLNRYNTTLYWLNFIVLLTVNISQAFSNRLGSQTVSLIPFHFKQNKLQNKWKQMDTK